MNVSSEPLVPTTIKDWIAHATKQLSDAAVPSPSLDAELMLADALNRDRTWLIAHHDDTIPEKNLEKLTITLARRLNREPLAYIRGYKEFYGRTFSVTPDTLIPRPDTEVLIELLAPLVKAGMHMIDIGTGSGAIAISAALEYTELTVDATEVSEAALAEAQKNAETLKAEVHFTRSNLLDDLHGTYDIICANLPYVDRTWEVSQETHAEPSLALYANDDGLALIKRLIEQAPAHLTHNGFMLLEADPRQHDAIIAFAHGFSFDWYETGDFIVVLQLH